MTTWTLGPYRALEHVFVVEGEDSQSVRRRLEHALAPLASPRKSMPDSSYRIIQTGDCESPRHRVSYRGRLIAPGQRPFHAAGLVLWHVNQRAVTEDRGRHLVLHAAAAERDGQMVVLLGDSGVGKTTTVAGLLSAGFRYVTDEALALDRATFGATPFPKALALNADVAGQFPVTSSWDGGPLEEHVSHVRWWDLGSPGVAQGIAPALLIRLTRGGEDVPDGRPERMREGDAILALAESTFRFRSRPRQNMVAAAALGAAVPAFRMGTGDVTASVDAIDELLGQVSSLSGGREWDLPGTGAGHGARDQQPVRADAGCRYVPVAGLTVVRSGSGLVLRSPQTGNTASIAGTAVAIWESLDGLATLATVVERLANGYAAPVEAVRGDVESVVSDLLALGLVRSDTE